MRRDIAAHVITHTIGIPPGPRQQMLHPIRRGIPGMLSDCPAVLARQRRQQPQHERPGMTPRLCPAETRADPEHQLIEHPQPPGKVYAVASGHRKIIMSLHKPG